MPRPPRLEIPGVPLHVIQRGNNRTACFLGDVDRRFYLKCLGEAAVHAGCAIHAYVLMTNHVHLLVTPNARGAVARMLQDIGRRYVRVTNTIHGRTGTLWEGRFKSSLVDTQAYLLICHRYIELNPVRAGLVAHAADYAWSSHSHYAGIDRKDLLTEHPLFLGLGPDVASRQASFLDLFKEALRADVVTKIREAANTGCALGTEGFLDALADKLGRRVYPPKQGRPPKAEPADIPSVVSGKLF